MVIQTLSRMRWGAGSAGPAVGDGLSALVGDCGRWQAGVAVSMALVKFSSAWVQMAISFLTPAVTFWCSEWSEAAVIETSPANNTCYDGCARYSYDTSPFDETIVSEWGLVCAREWLASFTQTALQLGILLGSILFGFLADRYGRKNSFLAATTSLVALGFALPFAPNYYWFTSARLLLGAATAGTMVISFVILMESVGPQRRELAGCLYQLPFMLGHMTLPLFAYYWRSWNTYCLALAVPPVLYFGYFFVLQESPRWLLSVGLVDEAAAIIERAAQINKLPPSNVREAALKLSEEMRARANAPRPHYGTLLGPALRRRTIFSCFMWLVSGLTFFGLNQYISQTSRNPFISVAVSGAIQLPANVASVVLVRLVGGRTTTAVCAALCGAVIAALAIVPDAPALRLALGAIGVCFAAIVATCLYVFTSALFPTVVRNMGLGASSTAMRLGSMAAPFVAGLATTAPWLPPAMLAAAATLAAIAAVLLPETRGTTLPDTIEQLSESH